MREVEPEVFNLSNLFYSQMFSSIRADAVSERLYRVFTAPMRLTLCTSEVRRSGPRMSDDTASALLFVSSE